MKKLLFALLIFSSSFAQEKFELTTAGFTDYVVTNVEGTQSEIYNKAVNWIKETYKNPDQVIKMTIENEKLRFEGYQSNFHCLKSLGMTSCSNLTYTIEISFKDGKYKFDPIAAVISNDSGQKNELKLDQLQNVYFKNGKPLKGFENFVISFQDMFNNLNTSLKSYISGASKTNNDW